MSRRLQDARKSSIASPATEDDWPTITASAIDGLEQNLCRSAPKRLRSELQAFKVRLTTIRGQVARRRFEREFDAYVDSSPTLRAAGKRWLRNKMRDIVGGLERLLTLTEKWKSAAELARKRHR
jgi:hypothetical protein